MRSGRFLIALVAALAAPAGPALAQAAAAPASDTIVEPTCADLMAALRVADAGSNPSAARLAAAREAQDDIATALFWLHGWHVAKGRATLPVSRQWMVDELKRVVGECRSRSADGRMPVSQAATQ